MTLVGRQKSTSLPLLVQPFRQKRLSCFFQKGKFFYLEFNMRLFLYLFVTKLDIICANDLDTIVPTVMVAKIKSKVSMYDAHEYFTEVPELMHRPFTKFIWQKISNICIPKINFCYTVCESLAQIFKNQYFKTFSVIRNLPLANSEPLVNPKEKKERIILYQGALNIGRGLEEAIAAMQMIENAQLWIAGQGDIEKTLKNLCIKLKVTNKVFFKGNLLPEELKKMSQKAMIGLNLLENKGLNYYYSLANKTFDYAQASVPMLNMNFPEYIKLNRDFEVALLLDNLDPTYVAAKILNLLEDENLYNKLKTNCLAASKYWNWEIEEKKLLLIYAAAEKIKR